MARAFDVIETTADVGVVAYGETPGEAFSHAAAGMFSLLTDLDGVQEVEHRPVRVTADDPEGLLFRWLNELVYLFATEDLLVRRAEVTAWSATSLEATLHGEILDRRRHRLKTEIKAATYHRLGLTHRDGRWEAQAIFDI